MLGIALVVLLVLLLLSVPIAATLVGLGLFLDQTFSFFPLYKAMGEVFWSASNSFLLIAVPLFVLLGEILVRAGIAGRTYAALDKWLSWMPGGLLHANIGTATLFSATSGSSVATAATVGSVAMPQAKALGYDDRLFAGSIAAGGTLGIMIPPSINLIVYGFLTETSIPRLFLAGLIPGLLLAALFMATAAAACTLRPELGGPRRPARWSERFRALPDLLPVLGLFAVIVGSIYAGWATPTEAAALGVVAALALSVANRSFNLRMLKEAVESAVKTTAMIMLIIISAYFLNFVLAGAGVTRQLAALIDGLGFGAYGMLACIILLYVILGFFIETLSLMVITIPIVAPVVIALGFDPIWFGVLLILMIEMALITPPVGLNLYVVQGVGGGISLNRVMTGALPFVAAMLVMALLLVLFPGIALYLPGAMAG
ncbi:TRAP transporter large permease [Tistrella mobilis]|uniref:TRAP transporter large permease protein n=1 Tax=Tistrella mobilis (strain KA081020-065) TaxID=1110502 RepID=I3TK25_TISMK|nr:TRAP transporter large permease [Tistrella mobilis]AFK53113.1 TRAP dicarboxylate transporter, DctM subunit [Tistrella mobilis KA081020-065]